MTDTKDFLRGLMGRYTTDNVDDPVAFRARIDEFLALDDYEMEGYSSPDMQRDKSVKFHWGHNHDFGDFKLEGVLGDRHIDLLASFIDDFGLPRDLTGKRVLDIGVWCGGTTMLLAEMGAEFVTGFEEVKKYGRCANFLSTSFKKEDEWGVIVSSIYNTQFRDPFDYVIFPGVLYHLTDPILALRILFNALKDGGTLFLETMIAPVPDTHAGGQNVMVYAGGKGWNWFIPSEQALIKMLNDVGFDWVSTYGKEKGRLYCKAYRIEHKDMLRAGLSNRYVA